MTEPQKPTRNWPQFINRLWLVCFVPWVFFLSIQFNPRRNEVVQFVIAASILWGGSFGLAHGIRWAWVSTKQGGGE